MRQLVMILFLLGLVGPAAADEEQRLVKPKVPCKCKFFDQDLPLGSVVCIKRADGDRLARCEMRANNPAWIRTDQECPTS